LERLLALAASGSGLVTRVGNNSIDVICPLKVTGHTDAKQLECRHLINRRTTKHEMWWWVFEDRADQHLLRLATVNVYLRLL